MLTFTCYVCDKEHTLQIIDRMLHYDSSTTGIINFSLPKGITRLPKSGERNDYVCNGDCYKKYVAATEHVKQQALLLHLKFCKEN